MYPLIKKRDFKVIKRYWDNDNNCEPTYPFPCIVWWKKGNDIDGYWYKGEALCRDFPNGEVVTIASSKDHLVDRLYDIYIEMWEEKNDETTSSH